MNETAKDDLTITLVRHGHSAWQAGLVEARTFGDHRIPLSPKGVGEARDVGKTLGASFLRSALIYVSPYQRTRETFQGILLGAGVEESRLRCFEDPRLREVEHGYQGVEEQKGHRETHGWFFYRYDGGESPADCYDRVSGFIDSLWRQLERKKREKTFKNVLIVTHGLTIRCFVMRFLHLKVEDFDRMQNPKNCAVITIKPRDRKKAHPFAGGDWVADGLEVRAPGSEW